MNQDIFEQLKAPFPSSTIKWRAGKPDENGMADAIPYIDARDVQNRLDEVCRPYGWQSAMKPTSVGCVATLSILCQGAWLSKEDGAQFDSYRDNGEGNAKELAIKGGFSDAFKRAAVHWGIGRYLYAYDAQKLPVNEDGSFKEQPTLPNEFLPAEEQAAAAPASRAPRGSRGTTRRTASASDEGGEELPAGASGQGKTGAADGAVKQDVAPTSAPPAPAPASSPAVALAPVAAAPAESVKASAPAVERKQEPEAAVVAEVVKEHVQQPVVKVEKPSVASSPAPSPTPSPAPAPAVVEEPQASIEHGNDDDNPGTAGHFDDDRYEALASANDDRNDHPVEQQTSTPQSRPEPEQRQAAPRTGGDGVDFIASLGLDAEMEKKVRSMEERIGSMAAAPLKTYLNSDRGRSQNFPQQALDYFHELLDAKLGVDLKKRQAALKAA